MWDQGVWQDLIKGVLRPLVKCQGLTEIINQIVNNVLIRLDLRHFLFNVESFPNQSKRATKGEPK